MEKIKNNNKQKLLVIYDLFGSYSGFKRAGSLHKAIQLQNVFSRTFEKVYVKTYESKKFEELPGNVEHIPFITIPFRKFFYFFFSGFLNYKHVDCVEVICATGIFPALVYKLGGARIFLYHRWDLAKHLKELKKPFFAFLANVIQIFALKMADTIAVTNKALLDDAQKYTRKNKIYLLSNYVDSDMFKSMETGKKENSLIFVGRLHQQKNLIMLLQVMKPLPQFKLQIVGDGPLREELIAIKRKNKIENVDFLGTIPHEKLPKYLNKAEASILISNLEGFPNALLEAMACGLPCIGTNVDGIRDVIVDGETGVLCEKNVEDIKRGILKLFADRKKMKKMAENARKYVVENHSMNQRMEVLIKLIKGELDGIVPLFSDVIDTGRKIN